MSFDDIAEREEAAMTEHPEDPLIDQINQLERDEIAERVDWQLSNYRNRSGYDHDVNQPRCPCCHGEFHGIANSYCPGALATEDEIAAFREQHGHYRQRHVLGDRRDINFGVNIGDDPVRRGYRAVQAAWEAMQTVTGVNIGDDPFDLSDWFDGDISDLVPPTHQFPRDVGPNAPQWLQNMVEDANAYTLERLAELRNEMWANRPNPYGSLRSDAVGSYAYTEHFAPIREPQPLQFPRNHGGPLVRFWTTGANGLTQMLEGTLFVTGMEWRPDGTAVVMGNLGEPVQQWAFDSEAATLAVEAAPDDETPRPAAPLVEGLMTVEAATEAGFEAIGTISPDALEITQNTEYVESWGGGVRRTIPTSTETSIEFDASDLGPAMERLFR